VTHSSSTLCGYIRIIKLKNSPAVNNTEPSVTVQQLKLLASNHPIINFNRYLLYFIYSQVVRYHGIDGMVEGVLKMLSISANTHTNTHFENHVQIIFSFD
jgi:hypothetical protein